MKGQGILYFLIGYHYSKQITALVFGLMAITFLFAFIIFLTTLIPK